MNVLEKILEEIDEEIEKERAICKDLEGTSGWRVYEKAMKIAKDIVRKHMDDGWIPVDRKLPPNANHKGALCPRYQVMTKYGVTEGWYNPDHESWFCLFWLMYNKFTKEYIDFERGDVPKVVQIEKGIDIVLAWRPMPEPYNPERSDNHDGE